MKRTHLPRSARSADRKPFVTENAFDKISRAIPLANDECDVMAAQISVTADRAALIAFTEPYRDGQAFAVDTDNDALRRAIDTVLADESAMAPIRQEWFGQ